MEKLMKIQKLIIAGLVLVGAVFLFVAGQISMGILTVFAAGLLVLFYFKNERNLLALYFIRKNKILAAEKVLSTLKRPERLVESQEGYYYFLSGMVAAQKQEVSKADKLLKKALKSGLRTNSDKAIAKLNLAGVALNRRNKKLARLYVQESKKLDTKKILTPQIKEMENMIKRVG